MGLWSFDSDMDFNYIWSNETVMKEKSRLIIKHGKGIRKSDKSTSTCKVCLYHDNNKVCQIHMLKTRIDEYCDDFTPKRRHIVYKGGSVSPK